MGNPLLQISGYCTGQTKPRARLDFSASTLRCTTAGQHQHLPAATAQVSWQQRNINLFCHAANVSWGIQVKTGNDKKNSNLHLDRSWVSHHKKVLPYSSSALPQYQRLLRPQKGLPTEVNSEPAVLTITKTKSSTATSPLCNTNVSSTFHRAVTSFSLLGALPHVSALLKETQYIQRLWTVSALRR